MSCLFQSIGSFVQKSPVQCRADICDAMERTLDVLYHGLSLRNWIEYTGTLASVYIAQMRQPNEWGGAIEIMVASVLYNVELRVEHPTFVVDFYHASATERLRISYTGSHYEPVGRESRQKN